MECQSLLLSTYLPGSSLDADEVRLGQLLALVAGLSLLLVVRLMVMLVVAL
ncbi:hypothetical protein IC762_03625 [Bradyrhizobium genosp. L]|uniref:hypothetical protein n=1 Tax=Bradyrhizobium genosp. L TaxID=83637 RepID=UPI0018A25AE6|nr:hypothetical protein [Bradyrhizobium genosp. L]QPF85433.1 hypothetical protein IC762_03625 [Bradyrhizobium genosp. L]